MQVETRAGFPIARADLGEGAHPALLIHCTLANGRSWQGLIRQMGAYWRARIFDLPGHGSSAHWAQTGATDVVALSANVALDLMPPDARVDLVGHSFGATVALKLALEHPGRVRSLTLIEPVFFAAVRGTPAYQQELAINDHLMAAIRAGDMATAAQDFAGNWGGGVPWADLPERARQKFARQIGFVSAGEDVQFHDAGNLLRAGALEALPMPVCILQGADTPQIVHEISQELCRRIPGSVRQIIPDAGHMLPISHPAETAQVLQGFLDRCVPA